MRRSSSTEGASGGDPIAKIIAEVIETEKAYVDDLDTMLRVYVRPARKLQILTAEQKSEIFSNVEDLSKCNAALLEQLQAPGDDAVATLARAFIAVAPFFKLYSTYCGNYQRALSTVAACRASGSGLSEVLASCSKNKDARGLSLESFLIKPVQRLTKYPLFFNDLLKQVPADAAARADLEKAAALVRDVSQAVDRSMAPEQFKLLGLLGQLEPLGGAHRDWLSLLAPHRQLLAEIDNITFATSTQTSDAVAYVLTDSLLVCKRGSGGRLKPRLLARLDSLTYGDEATAMGVGGRGSVSVSGSIALSAPTTPWLLPLCVEVDEAGFGVGGIAAERRMSAATIDARASRLSRAASSFEPDAAFPLGRGTSGGGEERSKFHLYRAELQSEATLRALEAALDDAKKAWEARPPRGAIAEETSLSTAHELDGALDELGVAVLKLQQSRGGVGSKLSAEFRKRTSSIGEALKKSPATPRGKDLGSR